MLIHVEVQTTRDSEFPRRLYVYNYRIFDQYNKPVATLAVLADDEASWRPSEFRSRLFGSEAGLRFVPVKLLEFADQEAELEASSNLFAKVVLAHLKARLTRDNPADRHTWKLRLVCGLYEGGFNAEDVRKLFRLIDWLMVLPAELKSMFGQKVTQIQEEKHMPFVTSVEHYLICKEFYKGIESMLRVRFGEDGLRLMPEVRGV